MPCNGSVTYVIQSKDFTPSPAVLSLTHESPFILLYTVEVSVFNPSFSFVGMPTLCPTPKVLSYSVIDVTKGFLADYSFVVVSKTSENWIQFSDKILLRPGGALGDCAT